ncbi:MAG: hypothetical protein A2173_01205 [Planctomycetes bacterium RBG_13_44_8b]|nr:MAG: hypothetical protein A2173_01205 [Planctomycetes bacterium RBG_13_44_8b]
MFNFFEQPWTLTFVAVLVLFGLFQFRSIFPEKRHWWQLLLPVFLAAFAFGLDFFVKTDLEKINAVVQTGIKAVEQENCDAIDRIIADNYSDSYHDTKADLMTHCRSELTRSPVEKNKKAGLFIEITPPQATADLTVWIRFSESGFIAQSYKPLFLIEVKLYLQKQLDKSWKISKVEIIEIDKQSFSWRQVR